jgi:hypothetical protein
MAGAIAVLPLMLFASVDGDVHPTGSGYGSLSEQSVGLLAPFRFPGSRFDLVLTAFVVAVALGGLATRCLVLDRRMVPLLAVLGLVGLAMPQWLHGVWGMQYRLPVVWLMLAVAALRPAGAIRPWCLAAGVALVLFAGHVGSIAWSWQPRGRQYEELRAALPQIPVGARLLAFWVVDGADPAVPRGPFFTFSQMPALAVIERDVFLPFLHKLAMMTVHAAPETLAIDTPHGRPIQLADLWRGADPAQMAAMQGRWDDEGQRIYWGDWPRRFDYALELHFGAKPLLPEALVLMHRGSFFSIHRVVGPL